MFEVAEAYERQRGRSSKLLAPLFVDSVGVRGEVLDVGCGTGALTFATAKSNRTDGPFTLRAKAWAVKGTVPV